MSESSVDLGFAANGASGPSWGKLVRQSAALYQAGKDPCLAINMLRPCLDAGPESLRVNATLRKDEWILLDERVVQSYQAVLNGVSDLLSRGLRMNIANPFGTLVAEYEKLSELTAADVAMYAGTPPAEDRGQYDLTGVPVPVVSKEFRLDERILAASRMRGQSLDTTNAAAATRVVSEKLESLLFAGGPSFGGYVLYGYTNHPNRNTGSLTGSWLTLATTSPHAIVQDVIAMKTALATDNRFGPYVVYIPHGWADALDNDYFATTASSPASVTSLATPTRTIRERLLTLDRVEDIRTTTELTNAVVMVDMSREVVEVGYGFEPRLIQWESQGGMVNHFRVMSIMTFIIRSDFGNRSGIAHYSV